MFHISSVDNVEEWRKICQDTLSTHTNADELFQQATVLTHMLGFDYLGFGIQMQGRISARDLANHSIAHLNPDLVDPNKTALLFNNQPTGAMRAWKTDYAKNDPLVKHARTSLDLLVWDAALFSEPPQTERWAGLIEFGMAIGVSQPSRTPTGSVALANISRGTTPITPDEVAQKRVRISLFVTILHTEMEKIISAILLPVLPVFTETEKEILKMSAIGKKNHEISDILSISEPMIKKHKTAITTALGANNFTQATFMAFSNNLVM